MTKMREQRECLELTQTDIALYCGVSLFAYQQWERGVSKPKAASRLKVIEILKLPENYFKRQ